MTVTTLAAWKAKGTAEVLRDLLAKAERGKVVGLVYAYREAGKREMIGMTGSFRDDPSQVLAANERIRHLANKIIDAREVAEG